MNRIDYRVYLVTDDPSRYGGDWLENIRAAVEGGVTCVQYRDTESDGKTKYARALALRDALAPTHTPLIINNDAALAKAVNAEGIHVGQSDLPPEAVRRVVGATCEIGWSITRLTDLAADELRFADCLGIGPVFDARKTKADASDAMGLDGLRAIVAHAPTYANCAIGGITLENASAVVAAGARGLAVVSAFSKAADPFCAAQAFWRIFA